MRDYGKVYTSFWTSEDTRNLSEGGRMLALYLMTCPHGNMLGTFRLTDAYAADDLQWETRRVREGFAELLDKGFSYRCERTSWVFIRKYSKWNRFENPNVGLAAGKLFESLSCPHHVKALLAAALREFEPRFPVEILDDFESLSEPFENPFELSAETRTRTRALTTTTTIAQPNPVPATADAVAAPQKKSGRPKTEVDTAETWRSYSEAYRERYRTEPVHNATVNAQMAQFVRRLGVDESPHVARFYVGHQNAYYVRNMHTVGNMLNDAEKLRTEWATKTQMTATRAQQIDKTQTNLSAFAPMLEEARAREAGNGE